MAESPVAGTPVWVDLSSADPAGSRAFYSGLFGWDVQVSADPQYGGYAMAQIDGKDVAGIGPTMAPEAPTAWMIYLGCGRCRGGRASRRRGRRPGRRTALRCR